MTKLRKLKNFLKEIEKKSGTGKGGMRSKFLSADLINSLGIDMHIAGGFEKNIISKIINNEGVGTLFPAKQSKVKPLKSWLATAAASNGRITVSTFLADVLRRRRAASVLFTGIENIYGIFAKDQVVEICDDNGIMLGVGLVRYNSSLLKKKVQAYKAMRDTEKGKLKTSDIIAIHYNYLAFKGSFRESGR